MEKKKIEFLNSREEWKIVLNPVFNWDNFYYRIKQEPTYRPFKDKDECWAEMQKHQPFGWIIKDNTFYDLISGVGNNICRTQGAIYEYEESFTHLIFADGSPFGIKAD